MNTQKIPKEIHKKVYVGFRSKDISSKSSVVVMQNGRSRNLSPRLDIKDYSSDGLEWGYGNNGLAQLSLAILADFTGNDKYALKHHYWFKLEIMSKMPWDHWNLTAEQIRNWISQHHPL